MAQKIWSEYFQIGNASAEEAIPGAIIHMQTRNGNDEALVGAVNMQLDADSGLYLPTDKDNPLEARVRHLEALVGALNATKETNPDAASATLLALLRGLMATGATESTLGDVKTAAEALAAIIDSGALKATLQGRTAVVSTVHNALEIRDSNQHTGAATTVSPSSRFVILIRSTLDQPVAVRITQPNGLATSTTNLVDKDGNTFSVSAAVSSTRVYVLDPWAFGAPNLVLTSFRLVALCSTPPTSGALSTYVVQLPN